MKSITLALAEDKFSLWPKKYTALAAIGIATGCRISEMLHLKRVDILTRQGKFRKGIKFPQLKKKRQAFRQIEIPKELQEYILELLNEEAQKGYERPDDYVFRGQMGKPLSRYTAYRFFRRELGPKHGTHWMRKTFSQLLYKHYLKKFRGHQIHAVELVREALGHVRIDTTIRYLGLDDNLLSEAQSQIFKGFGK